MLQIGYYYSDKGEFNLYKSDIILNNWVTNICYYDHYENKYYSPNMKNLMNNSRDNHYNKIPHDNWSKFIILSHPSFVLH